MLCSEMAKLQEMERTEQELYYKSHSRSQPRPHHLRKLALIWDVVALTRNALAYNEQDSVIVEHSKIVSLTLLKFIRFLLVKKRTLSIRMASLNVLGLMLVSNCWMHWCLAIMAILSWSLLILSSTQYMITYHSCLIQWTSTTIRNKLYNGLYSSIEGFINDIKLVFSNAKCYNKLRSKIYSITTELKKVYEREVLKFFKSCDKEELCKVEPVKHPYQTRQASERKQLVSDNKTLLDSSKELTEIDVDTHTNEDGGESSKESNNLLNNGRTRQVDKVTRRVTRSQTDHKRSNNQYRDTSDNERRVSMDGEGVIDTDSITDEGSGVDSSDGTSEEDVKLPSRQFQ